MIPKTSPTIAVIPQNPRIPRIKEMTPEFFLGVATAPLLRSAWGWIVGFICGTGGGGGGGVSTSGGGEPAGGVSETDGKSGGVGVGECGFSSLGPPIGGGGGIVLITG